MNQFFSNKLLKNEIIKYTLLFVISVATSVGIAYAIINSDCPASTPPQEPIKTVFSKNDKPLNLISKGETIADIIESISPSVVHINTETEVKVQSFGDGDFFFQDEFFKRFFGMPNGHFNMQPKSTPQKITGNGSGVIISSDGYILTNYHVVKNASDITVKTDDEKEYKAKLVGKDKYSDLAVIKINKKGLKAANLANSDKLRPGQWAIAMGSPHGLNHTVTLGIVSAVRRDVPQLSNVSFIQTDAAINPGNSGGPLLNINGEVIGINTAIMGTAQNIGFAIPINTAKSIVDELKAGKTIGHPWIGIAMSELTQELSDALGVSKDAKGVVIVKIMPDSPAYKAGLRQGDLIQRIDGTVYSKPDDIQKAIKKKKVGDTVNIQIIRDKTMEAKKVKLGPWGGED